MSLKGNGFEIDTQVHGISYNSVTQPAQIDPSSIQVTAGEINEEQVFQFTMDLDLPLPVGTEIELEIPPEISFFAADGTTVIL